MYENLIWILNAFRQLNISSQVFLNRPKNLIQSCVGNSSFVTNFYFACFNRISLQSSAALRCECKITCFSITSSPWHKSNIDALPFICRESQIIFAHSTAMWSRAGNSSKHCKRGSQLTCAKRTQSKGILICLWFYLRGWRISSVVWVGKVHFPRSLLSGQLVSRTHTGSVILEQTSLHEKFSLSQLFFFS